MKQDLVTVVVPIYNVEQYLDRCMESLVKQTYSNLEIILVDDGSPDRCPQMCEEWAMRDSRIRVIHKQNAGLGMARNTGIEAASGQYICFIDSDDYVGLEIISKAYRAAVQYQADLVVFGMTMVGSDGEIVKKLTPMSPKSCYSGREVQEVFLPDWIDNRNYQLQIQNLCLSACSCLFSMELIKRVNWRFVSERELISEDSYSLIRLARHMDCVAVLEESEYYYCNNQTSLTRTYRSDRYESLKKFYEACHSMAQQQGYINVVQEAIAGLFFSFAVAALKQIVASTLPMPGKKAEIRVILQDRVMQDVLKIVKERYCGVPRKLLIFCMRNKHYLMVYVMLRLQVRRDVSISQKF